MEIANYFTVTRAARVLSTIKRAKGLQSEVVDVPKSGVGTTVELLESKLRIWMPFQIINPTFLLL